MQSNRNRNLLRALLGMACVFSCTGCSEDAGKKRKRTAEEFFESEDVLALAKAAAAGDVKKIDRLKSRGVDVNAKGAEGMVPLMWAMYKKNKHGYKRLLEQGADPNIQLDIGISATSLSARIENDPQWLEWALDHGANPNLENPKSFLGKNQTPLFAAISSRNKRNIELLIKAGANLNHQDGLGSTPALYAATLNSFDAVYQLLEAGADFRITDKYGRSLAFNVIDTPNLTPRGISRQKKVLDLLEKLGVDIDAEKKKVAAWRAERTDKPERAAGLAKIDAAISGTDDPQLLGLLKEMRASAANADTMLFLSNLRVATLPPEIGELTTLNQLGLTDSKLTALPSEIGKLAKLTHLSIAKNQFTTLPPEIGEFTNLASLWLDDNQLTTLSPEIGKLAKLTRLKASGNQLTSLPPEIGKLTNLTWLDLGENQLTDLPPEFGKMAKLETLILSQNLFTTLPLEILQNAKLIHLHLSRNRLATLSPEIGKLTGLTSLLLDGNPITDADLEHLKSLKGLERLHIHDTKVTRQGVAALKQALPKCNIVSDF